MAVYTCIFLLIFSSAVYGADVIINDYITTRQNISFGHSLIIQGNAGHLHVTNNVDVNAQARGSAVFITA